MVVAAGAADGEAEEDLADGAGDLVQKLLAELRFEVGVRFPGAHAEEAEGDQLVATPLAAGEFVAGESAP